MVSYVEHKCDHCGRKFKKTASQEAAHDRRGRTGHYCSKEHFHLDRKNKAKALREAFND